MKLPSAEATRMAELEARVAALEEILEARSDRLRRLQRRLCRRDLRLLHAIFSGEAGATSTLDLASWQETTALTPAEVEETLDTLWASVERQAKSQRESRRR